MKIPPQVAVFGCWGLFHRYRYRNRDRNRVLHYRRVGTEFCPTRYSLPPDYLSFSVMRHFKADPEMIGVFLLFPSVVSFDTDFDSDSDFDDAFSALISGKAIVHTTGMPVAYSFELENI